MFFPTNHAWWFGPAPSVVTIHDLACLHFPDKIFPSRREAWYEAMRLQWFVRGAAAICTDSLATRNDVYEMLHCPADKIAVVPLGVADTLAATPTPSGRAEALAQYGLVPDGFLLYTGGLDFRKNLPVLLEAFAELVRLRYPYELILVGEYGYDRRYFPDIDGLIESNDLLGHVRRLERVSDAALNVLYREAKLFVFPSAFEGFGIPPLEAMASGTPVVCSSATSLPEVVGDAAELFDPTDTDGLVRAMRRVLDSPACAAELQRRGLKRAAQFSWAIAADRVADVLKMVAAERGAGR
jgi:glycosyltransferase involved in cell wall biosynthesis